MKSKVVSSMIDELEYKGGKLFVTFPNGSTYQYDAPEEEYHNILNADSPGSYFSKNVKYKYKYVNVTDM